MKLHNKPSEIATEEGEVYVDGPGGVAIAMMPEVAAETSDGLLHAACTAAGQRVQDRPS